MLVRGNDFANLVPDRTGIDFDVIVDVRQFAEKRLGDLAIRRNNNLAGFGIDYVERNFFSEKNIRKGIG